MEFTFDPDADDTAFLKMADDSRKLVNLDDVDQCAMWLKPGGELTRELVREGINEGTCVRFEFLCVGIEISLIFVFML